MIQHIVFHAFSNLADPRMPTLNTRHKFYDILVLAICGVVSGAEDWETIVWQSEERLDWFKTFLELPNGIPSLYVFQRVFRSIDSKQFERCFMSWTQGLSQQVKGVVAIDGKTIKGSHDRAHKGMPIHIVSAWATEAGLILGQVGTDKKSNEITAIPELLKALKLKGCLVTTDAMGCQKKIAQQIVDLKSDYLLQVKENHPKLLDAIKKAFFDSSEDQFDQFFSHPEEVNGKGHGRLESRICWSSETLQFLPMAEEWKGLARVVIIESSRTVGDKTSLEHRFYITSDVSRSTQELLEATRSHWGVESMHWMLDVAFNEDKSRNRKDNSAANFSLLRRIALNLIRKETTKKTAIKRKRMLAAMNYDYLVKVLEGFEPL